MSALCPPFPCTPSCHLGSQVIVLELAHQECWWTLIHPWPCQELSVGAVPVPPNPAVPRLMRLGANIYP